jgi:microcystin-dependent protein
MAKGSSVPVGCVLAYAGKLNNENLNRLGWAICDGKLLSRSTYVDLFKVIGTANGSGDGVTTFNLPDYRGRFLRGVDPTGTIDKEAGSRTAPASGGASGAAVGSVEGCYTAKPSNGQFLASVPHLPTGQNWAYYGSNDSVLHALPSDQTKTFYAEEGGDAETRPINAYVNFIIKLVPDAPVPTGAVVAFAGNSAGGSKTLSSWYMICDGLLVPQGEQSQLFQAIGTAHGGDGSNFDLPDYRGRFLRGVDNGADRDPDAASRTEMALGGVDGDAVGSIQGYATAHPQDPFAITVAHMGDYFQNSDRVRGYDNGSWNLGDVDIPFTQQKGGDNETRPVNINVDYYILSKDDPNNSDIFPVGAVIGFPGNQPPAGPWMLCNGSLLNAAVYTDLFAAIGNANGGDGQGNFYIPNYSGYFLRGTDRSQGRDPDVDMREEAKPNGNAGDNVGSVQDFATANPTKDITGPVAHLPTGRSRNAWGYGPSTFSASNWQDNPSLVPVAGGDAETSPINVNILFYIKIVASS